MVSVFVFGDSTIHLECSHKGWGCNTLAVCATFGVQNQTAIYGNIEKSLAI